VLQNHIQAGNGFAVVDVSSYGDLEDEQRHQLTRSLARAFGKMRACLENGKSQTTHWDETTDKMIGWISEEIKSLRIRVQLARGDIGSFNNRASMHVRDSYENHPDYEPCWLLRSWFR
jgi:hypothetical protein